jgi:hypothetical protein
VKVLMTNHALGERAGSESYLETMAAELRGLGHEVLVFSPRLGATAERLRGEQFEVLDSADALPLDIDVIHGQHADVVGLVRTRLPTTPLVFVSHSWFISLEDPLTELGAGAFVAFNDLTRRRLEAHEATRGREVVRLTQPVTVSYADGIARTPTRATPRRAVAVSRRMKLLPAQLAAACADQGIEFDWLGGPGRESADPREEMRTADIDDTARGGWVDAASYQSLEADGFTGYQDASPTEELAAALAWYTPELGSEARMLAVKHHAAPHHAAALVELYARVGGGPVRATPAPGLERLAFERYAYEGRAVQAEWQVAEQTRRVTELEAEVARLRTERDRLRRQRNRARRALAETQGRSGLLDRFRHR